MLHTNMPKGKSYGKASNPKPTKKASGNRKTTTKVAKVAKTRGGR